MIIRKNMNIFKIAIVALTFSVASALPQEKPSAKVVNWSNAAKATLLSAASAFWAWFYYATIIKPEIIDRAARVGLNAAIKFNKDFVVQNPGNALVFAIPVALAAVYAWVARDYIKNIWQEKMVEQPAEQQ
jgi:hypothetical protein